MNAIASQVCVLAGRQHGVVATWQLQRLGLTTHAMREGLRGLRRIHRGVCAVGDLTEKGWYMAAALAMGPTGAISHLSALQMMELRPAHPGDIHVSFTGGGRAARPGLVVHRRGQIETGTYDGIPVTSPTQALIDAGLAPHELYRALEEAARRRMPIDLPLNEVVRLRASVTGLTRSDAEARFVLLCHEHGFPLPLVNQHLNGFETDFHWPDLRLVVEVDGFRHHRERDDFNRDRYRGLVHRARGWEVVRVSADHVHDEPELVVRALQTLRGPSSRSSRWSKPGRESRAKSRAAPASSVTGPKT